ncbi:unnamed protein product, partial [Haemonchus placei]|uniref:Secreted protein n=1 Tax=Haemonchus placei TaxID=6290 RepID=A0A0N4VV18_HAEPC
MLYTTGLPSGQFRAICPNFEQLKHLRVSTSSLFLSAYPMWCSTVLGGLPFSALADSYSLSVFRFNSVPSMSSSDISSSFLLISFACFSCSFGISPTTSRT